jgi:drug/metabolite transporter (DMT)-like permease
MLVLTTLGWGLSFPLTKALFLTMAEVLPGRTDWFYTGLTLLFRFGCAGGLMAMLAPGALRGITRLEWSQGLGLGLFGGIGIMVQAHGLNYTEASTSAFLTQFYCLLLPLIAAVRQRAAPSGIVGISCLLVLLGIGILAQVDWRTLHIGQGELETFVASVLFTGQILWLERPKYHGNDVVRMSIVMFGFTAVLLLFLTLPAAAHPSDFLLVFATLPIVGLLAVLTLFSTLFSYWMMNRWQPRVDATHAGLIYCVEPVFASAFAMCLPGFLSSATGIAYPNEKIRLSLAVGGGLITFANLLMLVRRPRPEHPPVVV